MSFLDTGRMENNAGKELHHSPLDSFPAVRYDDGTLLESLAKGVCMSAPSNRPVPFAFSDFAGLNGINVMALCWMLNPFAFKADLLGISWGIHPKWKCLITDVHIITSFIIISFHTLIKLVKRQSLVLVR